MFQIKTLQLNMLKLFKISDFLSKLSNSRFFQEKWQQCVESASQENITYVMSFQLHVDIDIKYTLNHFWLL